LAILLDSDDSEFLDIFESSDTYVGEWKVMHCCLTLVRVILHEWQKIFCGRTLKITSINKKFFMKLLDQDSAKCLTDAVDIF